jgi:CheY-like chemotaxis protein
MPVMDGFEFLVEFDKLPAAFTQYTKIAMLTSSLEEDDIQRCFQFRYVADFINKPITEAKVREFISKITAQN